MGAGGWVKRGELRQWGGDALDVVSVGYSSPFGHHREAEVAATGASEVACVVVDHHDRIVLALAFGLGTASRGWSLPTTWAGDGEDQLTAAERAIREMCGWSVHSPRPMWQLMRWPDRTDLVTTIVTARARKAQWQTHPDVEDVDWFTRQEVRGLLRAGHAFDAVTAAVLFWWLDSGSNQ